VLISGTSCLERVGDLERRLRQTVPASEDFPMICGKSLTSVAARNHHALACVDLIDAHQAVVS
jgi:hypothetical protein